MKALLLFYKSPAEQMMKSLPTIADQKEEGMPMPDMDEESIILNGVRV